MPSTGRDWKTVRGTSPVPGGISTSRKVQFAPDYIRPELFYHVGNHRPSPDHRLLRIRHQQVQGHHLHIISRQLRQDPFLRSLGRAGKAVHFGNGRTGDIRVQNPHPVSLLCQKVCQGSGYHGFSHAPLAADHADHMLHLGVGVGFHLKALGLSRAGASLTAFFGT